MRLFQKMLLIQNPEPYLRQREDSDSAIVVENATLSWTKPDNLPDSPPPNGFNRHKVDEISHIGTTETLPTLRKISFTLPKVCFTADMHEWGWLCCVKGKLILCVISWRATCLVSVGMWGVERRHWFPAFWSRLVQLWLFSPFTLVYIYPCLWHNVWHFSWLLVF